MKLNLGMTLALICATGLFTGCGKDKADRETTLASIHDMRIALESTKKVKANSTQSTTTLKGANSSSLKESLPQVTSNADGSTTFSFSNGDFSFEGKMNASSNTVNFKFSLLSEDLKAKQDVDSAEINMANDVLTISAHSKTRGTMSLSGSTKMDPNAKEIALTIQIDGKSSELTIKAKDEKLVMEINGDELNDQEAQQVAQDIQVIGSAPLNMMMAVDEKYASANGSQPVPFPGMF